MPAPLKNTNAVKSATGPADSHLHLRVPRAYKARWVRAARKRPLTEWVVETLNRNA